MPNLHKTAGRLKIAAAVLPVIDIKEDLNIVIDQSIHSALQQATNGMVAGVDLPGLRITMPFDIAYSTFGLSPTSYAAATVIEGYLANIVAGTIDSASTHHKWAKTALCTACAWVNTFSGQEGGEIIAEVVVVFYSTDGDLDPITRTLNNAYPALSAIPANHGIGVLTANAVAYDGVIGLRYAANLSMSIQRVSGHPFPTGSIPSGMKPMLSIDFSDPTTLAAVLASIGVKITSTTTLTLLKYANSILSATGKKTLTIAAGYVRPTPGSGKHGDLFKGGLDILISSADGITHGIVVS